MTTRPTPTEIDLADPAIRADPYPVYARLRADAPLVRNEAMGYWLMTRYRDVADALRRPALFSNDSFYDRPVSHHDPANGAHARLLEAFASTMIFKDPPEHTRVRKLVNKAFTPRQIELRRPQLEQLCRGLLEQARARGGADFIRNVAAPFPILVIAELLGVPVHDRELIKDLSYQFGILFEPMLPSPERHRALDHSVELNRYLEAATEQRRRQAAQDLISALVEAHDGRDRLSPDELQGMLLHLLVAGNETSTSLITHIQLALQHDAALRSRVAVSPHEAPALVEEVLRYDPPLQLVTRQVTADVTMYGTTIPQGDLVALVIGSANRDGEQFDRPDDVDLDRPNSRQHLAFGGGPHFCLGSVLSRLEGELATRLLVSEFSDLRVQPDLGTRRPDQMIRGYLHLPAHFTGARPTAGAAS